ncbi:ImmA/IrrE family metallo-endopeptidase [Ideonella sp.]|uniref:ImmA/IrrE family metallo-endopeptidase n=1 Tax=Ideonella sp. TaxID=1929293 RepID=UPI0035AE408B
MRPGWNPTRRNRHAGTKAHGHGQDNRLTIPQSWRDVRCYFERLDACVAFSRMVSGHTIRFLVEPTREGWFYPCTVDDVCTLLGGVAVEALNAIELIVLRQPTRKQAVLSPVWGRAIWWFDAPGFSGPAIVLEAQSGKPYRWWSRSPSPEGMREIKRLRDDGHEVEKSSRGVTVRPTPESLRHTVLYRTLLHELGHHLDHRRFSDSEWEARTTSTREDFAHRYATEAFRRLRAAGVVPFPAALDPDSMARDRLDVAWFRPASDEGGPSANDFDEQPSAG